MVKLIGFAVVSKTRSRRPFGISTTGNSVPSSANRHRRTLSAPEPGGSQVTRSTVDFPGRSDVSENILVSASQPLWHASPTAALPPSGRSDSSDTLQLKSPLSSFSPSRSIVTSFRLAVEHPKCSVTHLLAGYERKFPRENPPLKKFLLENFRAPKGNGGSGRKADLVFA